MLKKYFVFGALIIFLFFINGCATSRKAREEEILGLRNQIEFLEAQVRTKDEEINRLKENLEVLAKEKESLAKKATTKEVVGEVKFRPKIKDIQVALRNAGFDPGPIDGKMGKRTRQAIREFQKANNLVVDGKVGKKTWALLKEYLEKKQK